MKTLAQANLELNKTVATLLGWTEMFEIGGSIMGRPPGGSPHSRDQGLVPNWAGDFTQCCELGLTYRITPHQASLEEFMFRHNDESAWKIDFKTAYRHLMLLRVIEKLREKQEIEKYSPAFAA